MKKDNVNSSETSSLRSKAEEQLKKRQPEKTASVMGQKIQFSSEADLEKLNHELAVHQIELELQNEELRKALNKAETTIALYISGQKIVEAQIQKQKQFFEQVFSESSVSTQILDKDGWCEKINPKLSELFGVKPEDIEGKKYNILLDEVLSQEGIIPILETVFKEGKTAEWDVFFDIGVAAASQHITVADKNKKRWFHNWAYPIFDQDGLLSHVIIQHTDITKRKRDEERLTNSETKYRRLFESAKDGILILEAESGQIVEANPYLIEILEYSHDELLGKELWQIGVFKSIADSKETFIELHQNGFIRFDDITLHSKSGKAIHVDFLSNVYLVDEKKVIQCNIRDISEKKQTLLDLKKAKEGAIQSDRLKSAFLANMSHEIRTPLNSIIGFSELMAEPDFDFAQQFQFSQIIFNSGNKLLSIISDIMDLSKIDAGEVKINPRSLSVSQIIIDIRKEYNFKAAVKDLELRLDLPPMKDIVIESDENKLRQILINFVGNALKFTEKGFIEIGARANGAFVQFHVKDTGIGIPAQFQPYLFERFRQAEPADTRKFGGNGLGLTISKALIELLGGKVWLESNEGIGSTFFFTVPIKK